MQFLCLGYLDEVQWGRQSEAEMSALLERCFAFDDELRREGRLIVCGGLDSSARTATIRPTASGVTVTDGPFAETKEQVGGFWMLEAEDREHAVALMSKHPAVVAAGFEIRPVLDHPPAVGNHP